MIIMKDFFKQLSLYYYNENDLSNMTCALCNSSMWFRERFIHFFFPQINVDDIESIKREVGDEKDMHSRVDLFIKMKNDSKPWLIEVKIYDQSHHFGQYEAAYGVEKERLGYITNYVCKEGLDQGYDVKTWDAWIKTLEQSLTDDLPTETLGLCQGYIEYVNKVCGLGNFITSLVFDEESDKYFTEMLRQTLDNDGRCVKTKAITRVRKPNEYNTYSFNFYPDENTCCWGFTGYVQMNGNPVICMGFCKTMEQSKPVYEALLANPIDGNDIAGECIKMMLFSSASVVIPMSEQMHEKFLRCESKDDQMVVMGEFIDYCLCKVKERLRG